VLLDRVILSEKREGILNAERESTRKTMTKDQRATMGKGCSNMVKSGRKGRGVYSLWPK